MGRGGTKIHFGPNSRDALDRLTESTQSQAPGIVRVPGAVSLFGFPSAEVVASVYPRSTGWRVGGALGTLGVFLVVAPIVALVPPHAPWGIGALVTGLVLARRRLAERVTLVSLSGLCPKCEAELAVKTGRLREPHPITCDGCHHVSSLKVELPPASAS